MKQKLRGGDVQILDPIENFALYLVTPSIRQEDVYKRVLLAMGKVFICKVSINNIIQRKIRISAENEKEAKTKAAKKFVGQKNIKIKCTAEDAEDADIAEGSAGEEEEDADIAEGSEGEETGSESESETESSFNFTKLDKPLEALNIIYPETAADIGNVKNRIGKAGLLSVMKLDKNGTYTYKGNSKFFTPEVLPEYSCKITSICEHIEKSTGIVLVYSRWLPAGAIPLALALEERGFSRYKKANLLKSSKSKSNDNPKNYIFISGLSPYIPNPDGQEAIDICNSLRNKNGELIKVIIITQAGAEGLDFKFIRQVHIMEPWHNLSRIEQTIGRAVRQKSHDALPFRQKNVELYLYGTLLNQNPTEEAADLYMYRKALRNAKLIGQVTRLLKETSVDCLLNVDLPKFSAEDMPLVSQDTASGESIQTQFGYKPYSAACDYMQNCEYTCKPTDFLPGTMNDAYMASYTEPYLRMNIDIVQAKIRGLMRERYFYTTAEILRSFRMLPSAQIFAGLQQMISLETPIEDKYKRSGKLIQIGDMYFFQPLELRNTKISMHDRMMPLEVKPEKVRVYKEYIPQSLSLTQEAQYDNTQDELAYKFNLVFHKDRDEKHKQDAWYTNCAKVMKVILDAGITDSDTLLTLKAAVVGHILDEVSVDTLIEIFNTKETIQDKDLRSAIHRYFKSSRYMENDKAYFITKNKATNEVQVLRFIQSNTETGTGGERLEEAPSENEKIISAFKNKLKHQIKEENLKQTQAVIGFTLKDILKTIAIRKFFVSRIKGATCSKGDITIDSEVLPLPEGDIKTEKDICIILELRLRLKDMAARSLHYDMFYFLSPAESDILLQLKVEEQNKAKKNEAAEKKKVKTTLKLKKVTPSQNKTGQNKSVQNKTGQNKTGQNKTGQNKTMKKKIII